MTVHGGPPASTLEPVPCLCHATDVAELGAWRSRIESGGVAVTEGTDEIRLDVAFREERLVHGLGVEAGHRAAVKAERSRREHQVAALKAAVPERRRFDEWGVGYEEGAH